MIPIYIYTYIHSRNTVDANACEIGTKGMVKTLRNFLLQDIKPENFMWGVGPKQSLDSRDVAAESLKIWYFHSGNADLMEFNGCFSWLSWFISRFTVGW